MARRAKRGISTTDINGMKFCADDNSGPILEMVGAHLGPRTRANYPYSYDPILQFYTGEPYDGTCYSDRLLNWYDFTELQKLKRKHFGEVSDYYNKHEPQAIEAFLRDLMGHPHLKLVRIEEQCNQATGFPLWFFAFQNDYRVYASDAS